LTGLFTAGVLHCFIRKYGSTQDLVPTAHLESIKGRSQRFCCYQIWGCHSIAQHRNPAEFWVYKPGKMHSSFFSWSHPHTPTTTLSVDRTTLPFHYLTFLNLRLFHYGSNQSRRFRRHRRRCCRSGPRFPRQQRVFSPDVSYPSTGFFLAIS